MTFPSVRALLFSHTQLLLQAPPPSPSRSTARLRSALGFFSFFPNFPYLLSYFPTPHSGFVLNHKSPGIDLAKHGDPREQEEKKQLSGKGQISVQGKD